VAKTGYGHHLHFAAKEQLTTLFRCHGHAPQWPQITVALAFKMWLWSRSRTLVIEWPVDFVREGAAFSCGVSAQFIIFSLAFNYG